MNLTKNIVGIRRSKLAILKCPAILYLLTVAVTSHLIFLLSSSSDLAQTIKPRIPTIPILTPPVHSSETLNDCDRAVLQADPVKGQCNEASPPVNSGDCLGLQDFCVFQADFMKPHLIGYPNRTRIVDKDGNIVVISGEAFADTALFFGKDKITLEEVLRNTQIQAFNGKHGKQWTTIRALSDTDYSEITNIRTYAFSDCGKAMEKFKGAFKEFEKLQALLHAGLNRQRPADVPRPAPQSLIAGIPIPSDPSGPTSGLQPRPSQREDRFVAQDLLDAALNKAVDAGNATGRAAERGCPPKTLPYYWTEVYFQYSPELGDTQLRLHVNSNRIGSPKDFAISEGPFKVYLAAASQFDMPSKDGNRDFSFQLFASGDFNLGGTGRGLSVVYNKNNLSTEHRASFGTPETRHAVTINGRTVIQTTARGRFPFMRTYDEGQGDFSEVVSQTRDNAPLVIGGGARVAYRIEVEAGPSRPRFVSASSNFTMPPLLTFASMGDSFSSGQGAPPWIHNDCHRSRNSGQYRAVYQFIKASNKACDYIFRACEGAILQDMLDQAQRADHYPDGRTHGDLKQRKPQVDLVKDWMTSKGYSHLSVALFGIGGNNTGFADVIGRAIASPWTDGDQNQAIRSQVEAGFAYINGPNGYKRIDRVLKDKLNVKNIIIFGYPDVIHNSDGTICKSDCPHPNNFLNTVQASELQFGAEFTNRLTDAVSSAGSLPGWHYVNILDATKNHGICVCNNMYYNTFDSANSPSMADCKLGVGARSDGRSCAFHPTALGYEQYISPILSQLNLLYGN